MSHELETWSGGSASFVSARVHAWHRLGTVLPGGFDAADAMRYARLGGWNVRKLGLQTVPVLDEQGVTPALPVPEQYATVRTNPVTGGVDVLGVVGEQYRPIQNEEHAALLDALVDESGAHFETAGSVRGGRQVFLSMKLPATMLVGGIDPVDTYLVALNSHDGSSAFRLLVSPVRVVCANTQAAAIRAAKSSFAIRHTSGAAGNIAQARAALGLTFAFVEAFQAEADAMIAQSMTDAEFADIVGRLWDVDQASQRSQTIAARRTAALRELLHDSPTNEAIRGTRWAAYQAVTEYVDHHAPIADKTDPAGARAERVVTSGAVTALKTRAFELIATL